jgi:hypothetical protein
MAGWRGQEVAGLLDEGITGDPGEPRPNLSWPLHHQLAGGSTGGWGGGGPSIPGTDHGIILPSPAPHFIKGKSDTIHQSVSQLLKKM